MYEATFHIRGDAPYETATEARDVSIELWCNDHCDLLHLEGDTDGEIREEIDSTVGIEHESSESMPGAEATVSANDEQIIITSECLRPHTEDNIESYLAAHDCLLLPPLRYESGGKVVRVITIDSGNLTRFYRDIQDSFRVNVRSKREVNTVSQDRPMLAVDSMVPDISDRQREAVIMAWEDGYYDIPRETTTTELAERMGIGRRTFEEHLRIAENKLLGTLVERLFT